MQVALFRLCLVTTRHCCVGLRTKHADENDDFRLVGAQSRVHLPSSDEDVCVVFASSVLDNGVSNPVSLGRIDGGSDLASSA